MKTTLFLIMAMLLVLPVASRAQIDGAKTSDLEYVYWEAPRSIELAPEDYAYIADGNQGVHIVDVENPEHLHQMGVIDIDNYVFDVAIKDDYAYLAVDSPGLMVLDISNVLEPVKVYTIELVASPREIVIDGDLIYLGSPAGLDIIGIADPRKPAIMGSHHGLGDVRRIKVAGDYAYISGYVVDNRVISSMGLRIVNVSNPAKPEVVSSMYQDEAVEYNSLDVVGDYAYLSVRDKFKIVNIINPETPFESASIKTNQMIGDLDVQDHLAFIVDLVGMYILDISDLNSPEVIAEYAIPGMANRNERLLVSGGTAYLTNPETGMIVFDVSEYMEFEHQNQRQLGVDPAEELVPTQSGLATYPNPFNPLLNAVVNLSSAGDLNLSLYNMSGQRVAELANGSYQAGENRFSLDAHGLAGGTYLLRATGPDGLNAVRKVVLAK